MDYAALAAPACQPAGHCLLRAASCFVSIFCEVHILSFGPSFSPCCISFINISMFCKSVRVCKSFSAFEETHLLQAGGIGAGGETCSGTSDNMACGKPSREGQQLLLVAADVAATTFACGQPTCLAVLHQYS